MAGYVRQTIFSNGDIVDAIEPNVEFNQLVDAFNVLTGHKHDGTTGEGSVIPIIGDAGQADPKNKVRIKTADNKIEFWLNVDGVSVNQVNISKDFLSPFADNTFSLGKEDFRLKDIFAYNIHVDSATIVGTTTDYTVYNSYSTSPSNNLEDNQLQVFGKMIEGLPELFIGSGGFGNEIQVTKAGRLNVYFPEPVEVEIVGGVASIDWSKGTNFSITMDQDIDITFTNMDRAISQNISVEIMNTGEFNILHFTPQQSGYTIWKGVGEDLSARHNTVTSYGIGTFPSKRLHMFVVELEEHTV